MGKVREGLYYRKSRKRLEQVPVPQVMDWADSAVWATQAGLEGYRQTHDAAALDELQRGLTSLQAAVDVLLDRHV
jgi:hypothetical protein